MTRTLTCSLPHTPDSYNIEIGSGSLLNQDSYLSIQASAFAIITDNNIDSLYGKPLASALSSAGIKTYLFSFPFGEQNKTRQTKEMLEDQLFENGLGKDTCVIALGGGVVTDIAGYIAATYCRGIPFVMVPTSLLGMVDACLGGKTGVNVPCGKNLLGCIYQPKKVIIDLLTLQSLPKIEISNGAVEMIKHGLIADLKLFEFLEKHPSAILELDIPLLEKAVFESCRIKNEIVEQDEKESGKRRLLNFGHTIGHALEKETGYQLSHGEAVAIGILVEGYMSVLLGALSQSTLERIKRIFVQYGLPLKLPHKVPEQTILDAMTMDKKSVRGKPRFIVIDEIGAPRSYNSNYCTAIDETTIRKALHWMQDDLCHH